MKIWTETRRSKSFYLPTDYRSRATEVDRTYRNLRVKYADPHDIWFTKLAAFRSKDKADMVQMLKDGTVDPRLLDTMFDSWNNHWFGGSQEMAANYAEVRNHDSPNDHS